jgi:hypothetical protein
MTARISILNPLPPARTRAQLTRRTLDELKGKVVGFVDNSKPNFKQLADDISALLTSRYGVKKIVRPAKRLASIPAPEGVLADLQLQCDLVVTGSGD